MHIGNLGHAQVASSFSADKLDESKIKQIFGWLLGILKSLLSGNEGPSCFFYIISKCRQRDTPNKKQLFDP